jgi:hypothetical protein
MPFSKPGFLKDHSKEEQRFQALFQNSSLGMLVANDTRGGERSTEKTLEGLLVLL